LPAEALAKAGRKRVIPLILPGAPLYDPPFSNGIYFAKSSYANRGRTSNHFFMKLIAIIIGLSIFNPSISAQKKDGYYQDKKNRTFRVFNKSSYQVVDKEGFHLYSRIVNVVEGKAKYREKKFFFSKTPSGDPIPLTVMNLKRAYPASSSFHDLLDVHFRKEYKLKGLFKKTMM